MNTQTPPLPSTANASANATSPPEGFDVMAQLASQYYSISRNRSFSAPIPPTSLAATWQQFSDDSAAAATASASVNTTLPPVQVQPPLPPPTLNIMAPVDVVNSAGAIGSGVPSLRGSFINDLQSLHINTNAEPENEPTDGSDKFNAEAAAVAAAIASGGPLPATFLRTICDQLEFYFCDENLLGDLFLLKNMNVDGYGTCIFAIMLNAIRRTSVLTMCVAAMSCALQSSWICSLLLAA